MGEQFGLSFILSLIDNISNPLTKLGSSFDEINRKYDNMGKGMREMGSRITKGVTAPIVGLGTWALYEARKIDDAFLEVQDRFEGTAEELKKLRGELGAVAMSSPHAKDELLNLSAAGLQIGVAKDKLAEFSKMMADFGITSQMSGVAATEALKELVMTTGDAYNDFHKILSVTTLLGEKMNTSAARVLETSRQIAPIAKDVGMSTSEIQATAAWMTSQGQDAGQQISMLLNTLGQAAKFGRAAHLPIIAHLYGKSTQEFQADWKKSSAETLARFLQRIQQLKEMGADVPTDIGNLGLGGPRQAILMARLAKSIEGVGGYRYALKLANDERERDMALTEDAERRYATFGGQLKMLRHVQAELGEQLGQVLVPVLKELVKALRSFAEGFTHLPDWMKTATVGVLGLTAAIGPLLTVLGVMKGAFGALGLASGPIGVFVLALTAVASALAVITANWEALSAGGFIEVMKDLGRWTLLPGQGNPEGQTAHDEYVRNFNSGGAGSSKHEVTIKLNDVRLGVDQVNRKEGKARVNVDSLAYGQYAW